MTNSPNLSLPFIMPSQAQKHVTHNEAIRALDVLVQLSVADQNLAEAPAAPQNGERHLVAETAIGEWAGQDGNIAVWEDDAWRFFVPKAGWLCHVADEDIFLRHDGLEWAEFGGTNSGPVTGGVADVNPVDLVGVNATADTTNRLSVSAPATLLNHEGNGHQLKLNKAGASDTASLLYQTAFSGRAEMGLTGDEDFHFKVSPDGANFHEAIVIDRNTGEVSFPNTTLSGGSSGGGNTVGATGGGTGPTLAVKAADQVVNNSNTLVDDEHLSVAVEPNKKYLMEAMLIHTSTSLADLRVSFPGIAGATLDWSVRPISSISISRQFDYMYTLASSTGRKLLELTGLLQTGANGGVLQFQWAQGSAQPVDTFIREGSMLSVQEL